MESKRVRKKSLFSKLFVFTAYFEGYQFIIFTAPGEKLKVGLNINIKKREFIFECNR